MVHTEVILQCDCGESLGSLFHFDVLFCLYCLMETVAPLAAFHYTARLLVDDFHLSVHHNILVVLIEHSVSLKQLLQGMHTLTLYGIVI